MALIKNDIMTMQKMTMCNVKSVIRSDKPIVNYHCPTLKSLLVLPSILAPSPHCFGFTARNFVILAAKDPDITLKGWWRPKWN